MLIVTGESVQGARPHMEDEYSIACDYGDTHLADQGQGGKDLVHQPQQNNESFAYFAIFDGHGGGHASLYAREHLKLNIVSLKDFWSHDDQLVLQAIKAGFIKTHYAMWREHDSWPKTSYGALSPCGTTASIAFIMRGKIYIGHVGDSAIVMGVQDPESEYWLAKPLTTAHKPESLEELDRIILSGGKVMRGNKTETKRVVWNRPRIGHQGPIRRSTKIDQVPFLAIARSLGDFWSYNSDADEFVVSPEPDVSVVDIDVDTFKCLILGSDGLWDVMEAQEAINSVCFSEENNEIEAGFSNSTRFINPSHRLVNRSLDRWASAENRRADNITNQHKVNTIPEGFSVILSKSLLLQEKKKNSSVGINKSKKSLHSETRFGQNNGKRNTKKKINNTSVKSEKNNVAKNLRKSIILSNTSNSPSNSVGNRKVVKSKSLSCAYGSRENDVGVGSSKRLSATTRGNKGNNRTISTTRKPNKSTLQPPKRELRNSSTPTFEHQSTAKAFELEAIKVAPAFQLSNVKKSISAKRSSKKVKKEALKLEARNKEKCNQTAIKRNLRSSKSA